MQVVFAFAYKGVIYEFYIANISIQICVIWNVTRLGVSSICWANVVLLTQLELSV